MDDSESFADFFFRASSARFCFGALTCAHEEKASAQQQQQASAQEEARQQLRQQNMPNFLVQQIVCYYFQRQQRSYFLNDYNRRHLADEQIAAADFDFSEPMASELATNPHADDVENVEQQQAELQVHLEQLSEYELSRLQRMRENEAMIAQLGICATSTLNL